MQGRGAALTGTWTNKCNVIEAGIGVAQRARDPAYIRTLTCIIHMLTYLYTCI